MSAELREQMAKLVEGAVADTLAGDWRDAVEAATDSLLALIPQHPGQGETSSGGWVLVPREPTPEMVEACIARRGVDPDDCLYRGIYRAMLAAAHPVPDQGTNISVGLRAEARSPSPSSDLDCVTSSPPVQEDSAEDYDERIDCWNCGGEGVVSNCFQEFVCMYPDEGCGDCTRHCDICDGKGGWEPPSEAADAAKPASDGEGGSRLSARADQTIKDTSDDL